MGDADQIVTGEQLAADPFQVIGRGDKVRVRKAEKIACRLDCSGVSGSRDIEVFDLVDNADDSNARIGLADPITALFGAAVVDYEDFVGAFLLVEPVGQRLTQVPESAFAGNNHREPGTAGRPGVFDGRRIGNRLRPEVPVITRPR